MLKNTQSKGRKATKTPSSRQATKVTGKASSPKLMQEAHNIRNKRTAK
ncbi:hypothetical protein J27TS8_25120 [Robertmurraya siralis]|uniref:Uncharacterized protein n=1 Tax=Robertmurraya siralis TaxID=77777 RepID=A0A919WIV8_9BACI|nr:hypothetical protein [Robertmurraya siralis]GIN62519.1 hypothetical protein J27TS8_25120 [Robertmurraya siralis]